MVITTRSILSAIAITFIAGCADVLGGLADPVDAGPNKTNNDQDAATDDADTTNPDGATSGATATVKSTTGRPPFTVADVVGFYDDESNTSANAVYTGVVISTKTSLCARLPNSNALYGELGLFIFIAGEKPPTASAAGTLYDVTAPGEYEDNGSAQAFIEQFPASGACSSDTVAASASVSGFVKLTTASQTSIAGSYTITMGAVSGATLTGPADGATLTGTFEAPICGGVFYSDVTGGVTCSAAP